MKKIQLILIAILSLTLVFTSCEEDQVGPTLQLSNADGPSLTSPSDGFSLVLLKSQADMTLDFTWTAANYKLEQLPLVRYNLVLKSASDNSTLTLASTTSLSYTTNYQSLNLKLLSSGLSPEVAGNFTLTVVASLSENTTTEDITSTPINVTFTPYDDTPNPIYLLGSGTAAGWSNTAALQMTFIEGGAFGITATLTSGSSSYIKFIANLGAWAPQWGTNASGTWSSGPLVYRPTESVPDPAAIPAPPESGDYYIVADTAQLTYTVDAVASKMFIATSNGDRIEMTKIKPMLFAATVNINSGKDLYIDFSENSQVVYHNFESLKRPSNNRTIFSVIDFHSNGVVIPTSNMEGEYNLEIDILNLSYRFTKN